MSSNGDGKMFGLDSLIRKIFYQREKHTPKLPPGIYEVYPDLYLLRDPVTKAQTKAFLEELRIKEKYLCKEPKYKR